MYCRLLAQTEETVLIALIGDAHHYKQEALDNTVKTLKLYAPDITLGVSDYKHNMQNVDDIKRLGLDMNVTGNHEAYKENENLDRFRYDLPWHASNLKINGTRPFPPYKIFTTASGVKIAVITQTYYIPGEMNKKNPTHHIDPIMDSIDRTVAITNRLKRKGIDFFFYLTHQGIKNDILLAQHILARTGLPRDRWMIGGGHDHALNPRAEIRSHTQIIHSAQEFNTVGFANIHFQKNGSIKITSENHVTYQSPPLVQEKKLLLALNGSYADKYDEFDVDYDALDYWHINELGAWFTEKASQILNTDLVMINSGTIREPLDERFSPENAVKTSKQIIPFTENSFIKFTATREQICRILEREVELLNEQSGGIDVGTLNFKNFLQVAGIRYTVSHNKQTKRYELASVQFTEEKTEYTIAAFSIIWETYLLDKIIGYKKYTMHEKGDAILAEALRQNNIRLPKNFQEIKRIIH